MSFLTWLANIVIGLFKNNQAKVFIPPAVKPANVPVVGLTKAYVPPTFPVASPRHLDPVLEHILDTWIVNNHMSDALNLFVNRLGNEIVALANKSFAELKVVELTGHNDGTIVELIQKTCGNVKGQSWCMDQQQAAVAYAERKIGQVSKMHSSGGCLDTLNTSPTSMLVKLENIQRGDIYIWEHGTTGQGHTENFDSWIVKNHSMQMFGGNTTAGYVGGKLVSDGGGSHQTQRACGNIGDMIPKGIIRAF